MRVRDGLDHLLDASRVSDIELIGVGVLQLVSDPPGSVEVDICDGDMGAGIRESMRRRPTDAGSSACNDRYPAAEVLKIVAHRQQPNVPRLPPGTVVGHVLCRYPGYVVHSF